MARSKSLSERLLLQLACLEILRFRQDFDSQLSFQKQDSVSFQKQDSVSFQKQDSFQKQQSFKFLLTNLELSDCPLFEETLNEILYHYLSQGIELSRSIGKTIPFAEDVEIENGRNN